jgi:hypothetical protein
MLDLVSSAKPCYYRCQLHQGHTALHVGLEIDEHGSLIPAGHEASWPDSQALNVAAPPEPTHPHDPDQIPLDLETP